MGAPAKKKEAVNHPAHYGGDTVYEVIRSWQTVKYVARAGKKNKKKVREDLEKARFYLTAEIKRLGGE